MGSPIEVTVPSFDTNQAIPGWARRAGLYRAGPLGSARVRAEDLASSQRFLVRGLFYGDPGILPEVLASFSGRQTSAVPDSGEGMSTDSCSTNLPMKQLSIDGLIWTTIATAIAVTAVVRLCDDDHRPSGSESPPFDVSQASKSVVSSFQGIDGYLASDVSPFCFIADDLFVYRHFAEYRFGVSPRRPDWRTALAESCRQMSTQLGDLQTPIAYLYFPSDGDFTLVNAREDSVQWAVVGVGLSSHPIAAMRTDSAAESVADSLGLSLQQFDPSVGGLMADRLCEKPLRSRRDDSEVQSRSDAQRKDSGQPEQPFDIVFAHGPAEKGLVARMLACAGARSLSAGSMTVLGGHTVAGWAVAPGDGPSFASELSEINSKGGTGGSEQLRTLTVEIPTPTDPSRQISQEGSFGYWIEWECPDIGGALNTIVEALNTCTTEAWEESPRFSYIMSRVVENGALCSGKGRFYLRNVSPAAFAARLEAFRDQLHSRLSEYVGSPDRVKLVLSDREASERPWAVVSYSMDQRD